MSEPATQKMTVQEIQAYHENVDALVAACLERIRAYPLPADVEPSKPERSEP